MYFSGPASNQTGDCKCFSLCFQIFDLIWAAPAQCLSRISWVISTLCRLIRSFRRCWCTECNMERGVYWGCLGGFRLVRNFQPVPDPRSIPAVDQSLVCKPRLLCVRYGGIRIINSDCSQICTSILVIDPHWIWCNPPNRVIRHLQKLDIEATLASIQSLNSVDQ